MARKADVCEALAWLGSGQVPRALSPVCSYFVHVRIYAVEQGRKYINIQK